MQLKAFAFAALVGVAVPRLASAQAVTVDTTHALYHESPTRTNMTVYVPSVDAQANPAEWLSVRAGWTADVVSGATVSTKAGPAFAATNPGADVVSTASVRDFRNVGRGGLTLRRGDVAVTGGYTYGTENDYRTHSFNVGVRTDAYDHNTQFELSYARNFDSVCDRVQAAGDLPTRYRALESSTGCFTSDPLRTTRSLDIDGFQASWSQSWTPVLATQLTSTTQILNGFQSNPYRNVILGEGVRSQEYMPQNRARQALTLRLNWYVRPLRAALRFAVRGYVDTWDVKSGTAELEFEKYLTEALRVQARGRVYRQTGALFWSDDYAGGDPPLGPKGQYWTGDRELSPFWSGLVGLRTVYSVAPPKGSVLGVFSGLRFSAAADVLQFDYLEYTLGGVPIANARAYILSLSAGASF